MRKTFTLLFFCLYCALSSQLLLAQGIGVNETGASPDPKAILDVASSSKGLLIPRLTTEQRNAISSPPVGLQVYNTSTNTIDIFRGQVWESLTFSESGSNVVKVQSLTDLPAPEGDAIILDPNKVYVFSDIVNISPYYINLNGAGLRGNFPEKDGVSSNVNGAILRSSDKNVFVKYLAVIPLGSSTKALDFSDATMQKECSIIESRITQSTTSMGVGNILGFGFTTVFGNFWKCTDGIKIGGKAGHLVMSHNRITGLTAGSGIEFLSGLDIEFINIADNEFHFSGQPGITLNTGVVVYTGRLSANEFDRELTSPIIGFDSFTPGWHMSSNTRIPDSRGYGFLYMSANSTATIIPAVNTYVKIAGNTTALKLESFAAPVSNRLTYTDDSPINAAINVQVGGAAPANSTDVSIAIAKNGVIIPQPSMTLRELANNQTFLLSLDTDVYMVKGDYIEVFIRNGDLTNSILISDMQLTIRD